MWYLDRKGEVPAGMLPFFMIPIVSHHEGHLIVYLNDTYYQLAQRHPEVPRMTSMQHEVWMDVWMGGGDGGALCDSSQLSTENQCCV